MCALLALAFANDFHVASFAQNNLSFDNFEQRDVSLTHPGNHFHQRRTAIIQLAHTLGNHVDQERRIGNDFVGFFD